MHRLLKYCPKTELGIGAGVLLLATFVDLLQPWPLKCLVDFVFGNKQPPAWLGWLSSDTTGIAAVCASILVLALLHRAGTLVSQFLLIRAGARIAQQLRCEACEQLHRLSLAYHDRSKIGDSLYRVAYDAHAAQTLLNGALAPMFTGGLLLLGAVIVMVQINFFLTLVTMAAAPVFLIIIRFFSGKIQAQSKRYHESESALVSSLQESLSSMRAVQAFTLEPATAHRFRVQSEESLEASQKMTRTQLLFGACAGLAVSAGTAALVWVAGMQVLHGRLSIGDILVFLAYLGMLYQPMSTFSQSAATIQSAKAQLNRVFEIIDALPEIQDRPRAKTLPAVCGAIEFRDACFQYTPDRPALKHINLKVDPGQVVALVGRTGAGKTTMASLLMRFYDPTSGAITLDGHDLRELRLDWLRRQVSVVLQDAVLFATTVEENIRLGRPGASPKEVIEAARMAQADQFIRALSNGYQTVLGERGVNLSGGQRQRISIARAFLKNAPILVLDEPTSALDACTEEALMTALGELMHGRTTFVIAHRLSTIRPADLIVVLENGAIIELGSHAELLANGTVFKKMHLSQNLGTVLAEPA
jgi:ATP-binding cassette subfamily B protein/subfamily B ATP-binding cassette protein MsbA